MSTGDNIAEERNAYENHKYPSKRRFDSRGNPTVEAEVTLESDHQGQCNSTIPVINRQRKTISYGTGTRNAITAKAR